MHYSIRFCCQRQRRLQPIRQQPRYSMSHHQYHAASLQNRSRALWRLLFCVAGVRRRNAAATRQPTGRLACRQQLIDTPELNKMKMKMKITKTICCVSVASTLFLFGCGTQTPRANAAKVHEPKLIHENDPTLILKSTGMPMNVEYSVNASEVSCENFEKVGTVRDSGRSVLLPWIARLSEKMNKIPTQLEKTVPAKTKIQVMGYGKWYDGTSRGSCGPLVTEFTPDASSSYLVEFVWAGTARCSSRVFDITDPLEKKAVPVQYDHCPRSFLSILFD
jgi:hypothetical protein